MSTWSLDKYLDPDGYVTATSIRALMADACPEMAWLLRYMVVTISEPDPDDLTDDEREELVQHLLSDLSCKINWVVGEPMSGNSAASFTVTRPDEPA